MYVHGYEIVSDSQLLTYLLLDVSVSTAGIRLAGAVAARDVLPARVKLSVKSSTRL